MESDSQTNIRSNADFGEDEIENLRHGSWTIDCSQLELRQRGKKGPIYSGPGFLRQDEERRLAYKIYAGGPFELRDFWSNPTGPAGTLLSEYAYCDLMALDSKGREWRSERILPGTTAWGSSKELVVEGSVDSMSCQGHLSEKIKAEGCTLMSIVFDSVKIPTNARTSEHRHVAGWTRSHRYDRDAWRFRAAGLGFLLHNKGSRLDIHVTAIGADFPAYLEDRVLAALFFVLGRPLYPAVTTQRIAQQTSCTMYSYRPRLRAARHQPPLNIIHFTKARSNKTTAEPYRKLFERFLSYTLPYEKRQHPLWGQLNAVYESSAGAFINSQALTLVVAIESVLGSEFPYLGKPSSKELKDIAAAIKYWDAWDGSPELKKRIMGSVEPLKQSRAGDKMRGLAKKGAITAEAAKVWQKLRNISVHAYQHPSNNLRKTLGTVRTLFYEIVFCAIGYRGYYHDYGTPGWPLRHYPPSKKERATGEEEWKT
jgi:hypothetical protein